MVKGVVAGVVEIGGGGRFWGAWESRPAIIFRSSRSRRVGSLPAGSIFGRGSSGGRGSILAE